MTSIAKETRTSVRLLADANSLEDVNFLLSGQLLQIPTKPGEMVSIVPVLESSLQMWHDVCSVGSGFWMTEIVRVRLSM